MKRILLFLLCIIGTPYAFGATGVNLQDQNGNYIGSSSSPLHVSLSGSSGGLWVAGNQGINTTSNVGIGSTNPGQALDVQGTLRVSGVIQSSSIDADQVFNIKSYGALGNGVHHSDGAITSTLHAFTSATGTFTANDVGKVITIFGAGTAGADLTTTISAFTSATAVTLTAAAGTTVTSNDYTYGTDDTTAIQTAINAVGTNGVGTVFFPSGIYIVNGAFHSGTYNSQLYFPDVPFTSSVQQIRLKGVRTAWNGGTPTITSGSIIYFTNTSGTSGQASISAYDSTGIYGSCNSNTMSNILAQIEDLTLRTVSNPVNQMVNFNVAQATTSYVGIEAGGYNYSGTIIQPTNSNSFGIVAPGLCNMNDNTFDHTQIWGFYNGFSPSEHAHILQSAVFYANNAIYFNQGSTNTHAVYLQNVVLQGNIYNLVFASVRARVIATFLDIENTCGAGWCTNTYDLYDPNNVAQGTINYQVSDGSAFTKSGGNGIGLTINNITDYPTKIIASSNVGIGTVYPTVPFEVYPKAGGSGTITVLTGGATNFGSIALGRTATDVQLGVAGSTGQYANFARQGDATLQTNSTNIWLDTNNGVGASAVFIQGSNGNVGIGTYLGDSLLGVKGNNGSASVGPVVCIGKSTKGQDCIGRCTSISTDTCNCTCL